MKTLTVIICLALLLSGCSTQREVQKNHSTGLYFNELNNLCLVTKVKLYDTKDEAIDVYVNNKKVVSELHDEEMALVVSNRDYITTRKSTTHNRMILKRMIIRKLKEQCYLHCLIQEKTS